MGKGMTVFTRFFPRVGCVDEAKAWGEFFHAS